MSGTTARWAGANNLRRIGQIRAAVGKSLYVVETEDCSNADLLQFGSLCMDGSDMVPAHIIVFLVLRKKALVDMLRTTTHRWPLSVRPILTESSVMPPLAALRVRSRRFWLLIIGPPGSLSAVGSNFGAVFSCRQVET